MEIQKFKREKITDQVFCSMRDMVLSGAWPVDSKIPSEAELAEQYGVSKMSVHAALQKLDALGLIDIRVGSGTYVKTNSFSDCVRELGKTIFTPHNAVQVAELRKAIELQAIVLAVDRRSNEELSELKVLYHQFIAAVIKNNKGEIKDADFAFHHYVVSMSGNDLFVTFYDLCYALLQQFFDACGDISERLENRADIDPIGNDSDPHFRLIEALEKRNINAAIDAYNGIIQISELVE